MVRVLDDVIEILLSVKKMLRNIKCQLSILAQILWLVILWRKGYHRKFLAAMLKIENMVIIDINE